MKRERLSSANRPVVRFVSKRRYVLWIVIVLLVVAIAAGAAVYFLKASDKDAPLSDQQQRTKDTLPGQEQIIQEYRDGSDLTKSLLYGNMAKSYADIKQCDNAWQSFEKAKSLAPPEIKSDVDLLEARIKKVCS